jgi:hypothetical protein
MAQPNERSIPDVVGDIGRHIQEIIRSEFLLAKTELKQEGQRAIEPIARLFAGAVLGLFAFGFFLLTCMFLLWKVLPWWLGALIILVIVGLPAIILVSSGIIGLKRINPKPERTVRTVKENVHNGRNSRCTNVAHPCAARGARLQHPRAELENERKPSIGAIASARIRSAQ